MKIINLNKIEQPSKQATGRFIADAMNKSKTKLRILDLESGNHWDNGLKVTTFFKNKESGRYLVREDGSFDIADMKETTEEEWES